MDFVQALILILSALPAMLIALIPRQKFLAIVAIMLLLGIGTTVFTQYVLHECGSNDSCIGKAVLAQLVLLATAATLAASLIRWIYIRSLKSEVAKDDPKE